MMIGDLLTQAAFLTMMTSGVNSMLVIGQISLNNKKEK